SLNQGYRLVKTPVVIQATRNIETIRSDATVQRKRKISLSACVHRGYPSGGKSATIVGFELPGHVAGIKLLVTGLVRNHRVPTPVASSTCDGLIIEADRKGRGAGTRHNERHAEVV